MRDQVRDSEGCFALRGLRSGHGGAFFGSAVSDRSPCARNGARFQSGAFLDTDFMPPIQHEQTQGAAERIAYAAEFAAFQLGQIDQIDQKLGLIELTGKWNG